jgi:dienelactone hydrolase
MRIFLTALLVLVGASVHAEDAKPFDAAAAFGALPSVSGMRLSPDGKSVSYIASTGAAASLLVTYDLSGSQKPVAALSGDGFPDRIRDCYWVSNQRVVCQVFGIMKGGDAELLPFTRLVAVDRGGGNAKVLSRRDSDWQHGLQLSGGEVIDWLPDEDGAVLMTRVYIPDDHIGTRIASTDRGLGVDRVDTRTLQSHAVEKPVADVDDYVSDGRGTVRVIARGSRVQGFQESPVEHFFYRRQNSRDWQPLSDYNVLERSGFYPVSIDHDRDLVYGLKKVDGRIAAYSVALDGSMKENLLYADPQVDVENFFSLGRRQRAVGISYVTDYRHAVYFDPDMERLTRSLARALSRGGHLNLVDASSDEQILLVSSSSDEDPGVYYLFNRGTKEMKTFLVMRRELEGVKLAKVKPVTYPAKDGTLIPGYLTLPAGVEEAKGLPALVLPHGGPSARDIWGFDWLAQFFAARGFAVLQPNYRGSAGYGDAWLKQNGFKSWRTSIGDVLDAGHWMISQGIADPSKLCILGWSYGGYAALQSAVVEPGLFKAVVAVAPVVDLGNFKEEWRHWSNFYIMQDLVGDGPHIEEGSPARHADKIKVPVLLFQGTLDRNVSIKQSRLMDARLSAAGVKHEFVTFEGLDHELADSNARTTLLRKSDEFLKASIAGGH